MNVLNPELVIVRGINSDWLEQNFSEMWIGFSGSGSAVPKQDAYYIGLYLEAPESKITHLGIVKEIERKVGSADFHLKALIKLTKPIETDHPIRKHENWKLKDFKLSKTVMSILRLSLDDL